jgi:predicted transcriptional regulator
MSTVTVRIPEETHRSLREIAASTGETMPQILRQAVEELRRHRFLQGLAADFAALREDREAWQEEIDERAEWDAALADDLGSG